MAPEGSESIYVLIPVTNQLSKIDWNVEGRKFVNKVINYLESDFDMVDLRKNIEIEEVFTPLDFQNNRNSYLGSPWGNGANSIANSIFQTT